MEGEVTVEIRGIQVKLTAEHIRMVSLIARGYTHCQIATELGTTRRTVCDRVSAIKDRLGTDSRMEMVLLLRDANILT